MDEISIEKVAMRSILLPNFELWNETRFWYQCNNICYQNHFKYLINIHNMHNDSLHVQHWLMSFISAFLLYSLSFSLPPSQFSHLLNFCMFYLVLNFNNMHVNVLLYTSENVSVSKRGGWLLEKFDVCVHKWCG